MAHRHRMCHMWKHCARQAFAAKAPSSAMWLKQVMDVKPLS